MSQYDDVVERQRLKLEAEEWAGKVKSVHAHSVSSMWYDTRPQDTADGKTVTDIEYNNGTVRRELRDGGTYIFGKAAIGQNLIDDYVRAS
jgi:hypothetical protein